MNAFRRVRSHWYLEPRQKDTWKEAETETKVSYTERGRLGIFNFYYCWCQALDSEQLLISEQLRSVSRRKIFSPSISLKLVPVWGSWFLYFHVYPFNKFIPWSDLSEPFCFVPTMSNSPRPVSLLFLWQGQGNGEAGPFHLEHIVTDTPAERPALAT